MGSLDKDEASVARERRFNRKHVGVEIFWVDSAPIAREWLLLLVGSSLFRKVGLLFL